MRRWLRSARVVRAFGVGAIVGLALLIVMPVGAATGDEPRLNEPVFRGQVNSTNAVTTLRGSVSGGASLTLDNQAARRPALELVVASGAPLKVNSKTRVRLLNADLLDGKHVSALALKDHTHAGLYLPMTGRAADSDRLDGLDSIAFALSGHNHNTAYVSQVGSPTAGNFPTLTAAGELANSTWGPSSFALSDHNHDTTYLGIGATASDSNLLDGLDSIAFALTGHSHAGVYLPVAGMAADSSLLDGLDSAAFSLATHDHAGLYSPLGHNHTGTYLPLSGMAADSSLLDGLDSAAFSLATHDHAGLYSPLGHNHTGTYLPLSGMAADSSLLDGLDSASFALTGHSHSGVYLPVGGVAADSSLLDGLDSSAFSPTTHDHDTAYLGIGATATDSDQLDGLDANQLMRAASGAIGDAPDANGDAVTASITAPQAGFLVISGSLEAAGTSDDFGCRLSLDTSPISSSDRNTSLQGLAVCSTDGMLPVTAGAHTVALVTFGWDSAAFGNATVWVVFVPFGATG